MEVLHIETWATPGRPAAVGKFGHVVIGPANSQGEMLVSLTLSGKLAKKLYRHGRGKIIDRAKRKKHNA